jgi:hypothetical protein
MGHYMWAQYFKRTMDLVGVAMVCLVGVVWSM